DLMIEHVEKYVCPSITSDQILGGQRVVVANDQRPHAAFVIAEDQDLTGYSVPGFSSQELTHNFGVRYVLSERNDRDALESTTPLETADVVLVSVRRRVLPKDQLDAIRKYVASGKPLVGIRTASHAFSPRGNDASPQGRDVWKEFDPQVLGGHYVGHHDASK